MKTKIGLGLAMAICVASITPAPAGLGRIHCHDDYQVTRDGQEQTPYCMEDYLAKVARSYGMAVTGSQIHRSFSTARTACKLVGQDARMTQICLNGGFIPQHHRNCLGFVCNY